MRRRFLAAVALAGALGSAVAEALPVYVKVSPPAPKVEVKVVAPGPGYVWTGGYYKWHGGAYVWVPGRWMMPPRPGAVWIPGHWKSTPSGWYWRPGHWK
ncbi:MAG TPA: YXWGXW repeat-containing protein [Thermoanaerobaculia bacterium]|nr:YXWGXW repeat-containing protein [Thermoanaerobaculia bacterium]